MSTPIKVITSWSEVLEVIGRIRSALTVGMDDPQADMLRIMQGLMNDFFSIKHARDNAPGVNTKIQPYLNMFILQSLTVHISLFKEGTLTKDTLRKGLEKLYVKTVDDVPLVGLPLTRKAAHWTNGIPPPAGQSTTPLKKTVKKKIKPADDIPSRQEKGKNPIREADALSDILSDMRVSQQPQQSDVEMSDNTIPPLPPKKLKPRPKPKPMPTRTSALPTSTSKPATTLKPTLTLKPATDLSKTKGKSKAFNLEMTDDERLWDDGKVKQGEAVPSGWRFTINCWRCRVVKRDSCCLKYGKKAMQAVCVHCSNSKKKCFWITGEDPELEVDPNHDGEVSELPKQKKKGKDGECLNQAVNLVDHDEAVREHGILAGYLPPTPSYSDEAHPCRKSNTSCPPLTSRSKQAVHTSSSSIPVTANIVPPSPSQILKSTKIAKSSELVADVDLAPSKPSLKRVEIVLPPLRYRVVTLDQLQGEILNIKDSQRKYDVHYERLMDRVVEIEDALPSMRGNHAAVAADLRNLCREAAEDHATMQVMKWEMMSLQGDFLDRLGQVSTRLVVVEEGIAGALDRDEHHKDTQFTIQSMLDDIMSRMEKVEDAVKCLV